jgi:hypothetical protein
MASSDLVRATRYRLARLDRFLKQLVQIGAFEQAIAIYRISMHRDVAAGSPFADRVVVDAEEFSRRRILHVVRQFGHDPGLDSWSTHFANPIN